MKKVLITGANSYIGTSFENWIKNNCPGIETETLDMTKDSWKDFSFQGFDSVFHVAGIAHADSGKISKEREELYYRVNRDLTLACAEKAKEAGVPQFLFMSSIIVYGDSAGFGQRKVITKDTPLAPKNCYGDSKVQAEKGLQQLMEDSFRVVILRPPMIYGKHSKGNYPLLSKFARKLPVFPKVENRRSMLYVGNLCKFVSLMILEEEQGIFYPQNPEILSTTEMVRRIAKVHGRKIWITGIFQPGLRLLAAMGGKLGNMVQKAFGSLEYAPELSTYKIPYQIYDTDTSIELTEGEM